MFHALAQVTVQEAVRFSYSDPDADLLLREQLDELNFTELAPGTLLGQVHACYPANTLPLIARTDDGQEVSDQFFRLEGNRLVLAQTIMPCMLSMDERVIRQDCLCYLMERIG